MAGQRRRMLASRDPDRQSLVPDQTCMHEGNAERMKYLQEDDMGARRRGSTYLCLSSEHAPYDGSLTTFLLSLALYPTSQLLVPKACRHPCLLGLRK